MNGYALIVYDGKPNLHQLKDYARSCGALHLAIHVSGDGAQIVDIRGKNRRAHLKEWNVSKIDEAVLDYSLLMDTTHPRGRKCIISHASKKNDLPEGLEFTVEAMLPTGEEPPHAKTETPEGHFHSLFR